MNALTVTQPFASLIAGGQKRIETRSWRPSRALIGQRLAIHAGKGLSPLREFGVPGTDRGLQILCDLDRYRDPLVDAGWGTQARGMMGRPFIEAGRLPRGAVVAICTLAQVVWIDAEFEADLARTSPRERALGGYAPGRFAWELVDVVALPEPVVCTGGQGVWRCDLDPSVFWERA